MRPVPCRTEGGRSSSVPLCAWDFIPSTGTVQIVVPDAEYMWFGVWARQTVRHDVIRIVRTTTSRPTFGRSRQITVGTLCPAVRGHRVGDLSRPRRRAVRGLRAGHGRFRNRQLHRLGNASSGLRCLPEHGLRDDHGVQQRSKLVPGPEAENITGGTIAAGADQDSPSLGRSTAFPTIADRGKRNSTPTSPSMGP